MATISLTLPSDGQTIDASDVNNPFNTIAAEINGNLDNSNIKAGAAIDRSKIAGFTDGWESLGYAPTTITALGNRSYTVLVPSVDTTSATSLGQRLKLPRTVTAPTYMGGAFNGTSHYFTKVTPTGTLSTVTNNFTIMAHVEPTAYQAATVASRADAASNNGFILRMESDGRVSAAVINGGAANYRILTTYQSLPLNKKSHIAASWTSGTVVIYFDGKSVPVATAVTGGTAPTVAGTGGDFSVGREGAASAKYWAGYISSVGAFDAVLTGATILQHMNQALTGSETNCIGAWNLNNAATDATASANNLTATGGVGYTARTPFTNSVTGTSVTAGTTNYGIITAQTFSTNTTYTVQIPEGETLPTTGGIGTISYSTQKTPYGFPGQGDKWELLYLILSTFALGVSAGVLTNTGNMNFTFPIGSWNIDVRGTHYVYNSSAVGVDHTNIWLGTASATTALLSQRLTNTVYAKGGTGIETFGCVSMQDTLSFSTAQVAYLNSRSGFTVTTNALIAGDLPTKPFVISLRNAYL